MTSLPKERSNKVSMLQQKKLKGSLLETKAVFGKFFRKEMSDARTKEEVVNVMVSLHECYVRAQFGLSYRDYK